jgi:Flp pilus assembly pilin Flp
MRPTPRTRPNLGNWGTVPKTVPTLRQLLRDEHGQDIAEYAVMLAVILIIVVGTVRLIGTNANSTFSNVASSLQ